MIIASMKNNPPKFTYPCMMLHTKSKQLVLFSQFGVGTRVYSEVNESTIGYYSTSWNMEQFEDFAGSVELKTRKQND